MQNYSLTVDKFLIHAAKWCGTGKIVTADKGDVVARSNYRNLHKTSSRLSGALLGLNLCIGDRVGTLAWNTQSHLELYYATMGCGLVCHTLNPRLTPAHLISIINEAEDKVLAVAANLVPLVAEILEACPSVKHIVILDDSNHEPAILENPSAKVWRLNDLIEQHGRIVEWGNFSEHTPAGLCYTSGTTGNPKGVVYTHRSNYLQTLRAQQADAIALRPDDTVLVAVPMFHANGWGLPFLAPTVGANIVLPGRYTDGQSLTKLMISEKVTFAAGVQTVWLGVLDYLDATGSELPDLKRILIGGAKCPQSLIDRMQQRFDAEVQTSWGMTELSPLGTVATPHYHGLPDQKSGHCPLGLDLKLTDAEGKTLTEQRDVIGHLKVKGHSAVDRYFKSDKTSLDEDGFFDTGDLAMIDQNGNLTICGRSKDLIKSGGEWINPAEIEEIVGSHSAVAQVAVIGYEDAKWGERPAMIIERSLDSTVTDEDLRLLLKGKIADWWMPNKFIFIKSMPLAATGKIDKVQLRVDLATSNLVLA